MKMKHPIPGHSQPGPYYCEGTPHVCRIEIHKGRRGIRGLTEAQFEWLKRIGQAHLIH